MPPSLAIPLATIHREGHAIEFENFYPATYCKSERAHGDPHLDRRAVLLEPIASEPREIEAAAKAAYPIGDFPCVDFCALHGDPPFGVPRVYPEALNAIREAA